MLKIGKCGNWFCAGLERVMSFWELVIFVLGLACPRTGILPFFVRVNMYSA